MEQSVRFSRKIGTHQSLWTPNRERDQKRLTKTMDSVEIIRKRKSTREKNKKSKTNDISSDYEIS